MSDRRRVGWRRVAIVAALAVAAQGAAQGAGPATVKGMQEGVVVRANLKDWSSTPGLEGLGRVFEYLTHTDLAALPLGRTAIDGDDVYVIVSEAETLAPEAVRFEAHRRYIDIQLVLRGQEAIGLAPVTTLVTSQPYDPAKDVEFFATPQESATLALRAGELVVFEPADGHRPSLHLDGPHVSRKAVVKVSLAYRERQRAAGVRP